MIKVTETFFCEDAFHYQDRVVSL